MCALIAAAGTTKGELEEFVSYLRKIPQEQFISDVLNIKKAILENALVNRGDAPSKNSRLPNVGNNLEDKIHQLLNIEAGLTKTDASNLLHLEIIQKYPGLSLPKPGKQGFNVWLSQISKRITPSEILHLATSIRNQHVQSPGSDWRLK